VSSRFTKVTIVMLMDDLTILSGHLTIN